MEDHSCPWGMSAGEEDQNHQVQMIGITPRNPVGFLGQVVP
jgi:hypothetical protein